MTDFEAKYKNLYRRIYEFHQRWHATTSWDDLVIAMHQFNDTPFERALVIAIYGEIERTTSTEMEAHHEA